MAAPFETTLSPKDEKAFQEWKKVVAPQDSGQDYDWRGAFLAGLAPDHQSGHWDDAAFKKSGPPTDVVDEYVAPTRIRNMSQDSYTDAAVAPLDGTGGSGGIAPSGPGQSLLMKLLPQLLPALITGTGAALSSPIRSGPMIAGQAMLGGLEGWQKATPSQEDLYYEERTQREHATYQEAVRYANSLQDPELKHIAQFSPDVYAKIVADKQVELMAPETAAHLRSMGYEPGPMPAKEARRLERLLITKNADERRMIIRQQMTRDREIELAKLKPSPVSPYDRGRDTARGTADALKEQGVAMDEETDRLEQAGGADPQLIKRRRYHAADLKAGHQPVSLGAQTAEDVGLGVTAKGDAERAGLRQIGESLSREVEDLRKTDPERAMRMDAQIAQLNAGLKPTALGGPTGREIAAHTEARLTAEEPFKVGAQERKDASSTALELLRQTGRLALEDVRGIGDQALEVLRQGGRQELEGTRAADREHLQGLQAATREKLQAMQVAAATALQSGKAEDAVKAQQAQIAATRALEDQRFEHQTSRDAVQREQQHVSQMEQVRQKAVAGEPMNEAETALWEKDTKGAGATELRDMGTRIATQIEEGRRTADTKRMGKVTPYIEDALAKRGIDVFDAQRDEAAILQFTHTMNQNRQVFLRQAVENSYDLLDNIQSQFDEWTTLGGASGYRSYNRTNLIGSKQVPGRMGEVARGLDQQIGNFNSEFSKVLSGGYAGTDKTLEEAQKNLNAADNTGQFREALKQVRIDLKIRRNAYRVAVPFGVSPGSPRLAPTQAPEPLTAPTPTPAGVIDIDALGQ